jgi:rRNA maturation endonuclease Nob1
MKKVLILAALILGTSVMVNAQTLPVKTTPTKEVKELRHPKKRLKTEKKVAAVKTEAPKMEPVKSIAIKSTTAKTEAPKMESTKKVK